MSPKQTKWYWRQWGAVRRADPTADRHALHVAALGYDRSSKSLTGEELDKVIAQFWTVTRPNDVDAQLRQMSQTLTRLRWKVKQQVGRLRVYIAAPESYVARILQDKFGCKAVEQLAEKQIRQMIFTLEARIRSMERQEQKGAVEPF